MAFDSDVQTLLSNVRLLVDYVDCQPTTIESLSCSNILPRLKQAELQDKDEQQLYINQDGDLELSNGGTVQLPQFTCPQVISCLPADLQDGDDVNDADPDPVNEIQNISISGDDITLSNGGGTISITHPAVTHPTDVLGSGTECDNSAGFFLTKSGTTYNEVPRFSAQATRNAVQNFALTKYFSSFTF